MLTRKQARKALKDTNELITPLARGKFGWRFYRWNTGFHRWEVTTTHCLKYREAQETRKEHRLGQAARDLGIAWGYVVRELKNGGRAESILTRAARAAKAGAVYQADIKKAA